MSQIVRITERDLRDAMGDNRYWRVGHPERGAFQDWVGKGFRGLNPEDGDVRSAVWVRAYMREGHQVAAHWRSPPPSRGDDLVEAKFSPGESATSSDVHLISRLPGRPRQPMRGPSDGRGGAGATRPGITRERREGSDGRDRVEELRRDPHTQHRGTLENSIDQWDRSGGAARREADLRLLGAGPPDVLPNGNLRYLLPNGSIATARRSTTPNRGSELTLEIAHPREATGRFERTDKFRYPETLRSQ